LSLACAPASQPAPSSREGGRSLGRAPVVNGKARLAVVFKSLGRHTIQAVYLGNAAFQTRTALPR
jgi:hypothetical protein